MKAGFCGNAPILAMASSSVAIGLGFAGALKPMWLSEIWRNVKPVAACALASEIPSSDDDRGTPPAIVHSTPVPAQIMHSNAPRRSMPSFSFCPIALSLAADRRPTAEETAGRGDLFPVISWLLSRRRDRRRNSPRTRRDNALPRRPLLTVAMLLMIPLQHWRQTS